MHSSFRPLRFNPVPSDRLPVILPRRGQRRPAKLFEFTAATWHRPTGTARPKLAGSPSQIVDRTSVPRPGPWPGRSISEYSSADDSAACDISRPLTSGRAVMTTRTTSPCSTDTAARSPQSPADYDLAGEVLDVSPFLERRFGGRRGRRQEYCRARDPRPRDSKSSRRRTEPRRRQISGTPAGR